MRTVLVEAGDRILPELSEGLAAFAQRELEGRGVVDGTCAVPGHAGVWALGDCAAIPRPGSDKPYGPTAQNATREGTLVARNIVATLRGRPAARFTYRPIGELALVGKRAGVAHVYGVPVSGLPAWALWRAVYLGKLPGAARRARVALDWLGDLAAPVQGTG